MEISFKDTAAILSAMIIPIVLIMATLNLILTTSQRSGKVMDRVRELLKHKKIKKIDGEIDKIDDDEIKKTMKIILILVKRSKFLQHSLWFQYLALSDFLATSISLAVIKTSNFKYYHVPLILGIIGIVLLFGASIMLVLESRLAVKALNQELKNAFQKFTSN